MITYSPWLCFLHGAGQITPEESLFVYQAGTGASDFAHPEHIPVFTNEMNISADTMTICGGNAACMFDATATNDTSVGLNTMMTSQALVQQQASVRK